MEFQLKIAAGNDDFNDLRDENGYFVDKTAFLKTVFSENSSKVLLITRPRRFGKSLTLSMFHAFLSMDLLDHNCQDHATKIKKRFHNTEILNDQLFCQRYLGKFPVISLTLKDIDDQTSFEALYRRFALLINETAGKFAYLLESPALSAEQKQNFKLLLDLEFLRKTENKDILGNSLHLLTELLYTHTNIKPVLLIDEYDVPLNSAAPKTWYEETLGLLRNFLSSALKPQPIHFTKAVLTGCLKISKESIFTGLNNLMTNSVLDQDIDFAKALGFTNEETASLLKYYDLDDCFNEVKKNYDGYCFAGIEIYCPWDVIKFCEAAIASKRQNRRISYGNYWVSSSGNEIIRQFLDVLGAKDVEIMQDLLNGKSVKLQINENLNYDDLQKHRLKDFWTLMLHTGYLTITKNCTAQENEYEVRIPNAMVKEAFTARIIDYYATAPKIKGIGEQVVLSSLNADPLGLNRILLDFLEAYVSVRDIGKGPMRENHYHGIMTGLIAGHDELIRDFSSNQEAGNGYPDITFLSANRRTAVIMELKQSTDLNAVYDTAGDALEQIKHQKYATKFQNDPLIEKIFCYGICFCKKNCAVAFDKIIK